MRRSPPLVLGLLALWAYAGTVTAQQRGADVAGRVTDVDGKPVAGATVTWVRQRHQSVTGACVNVDEWATAAADSGGAFQIARPPASGASTSYFLRAAALGYAAAPVSVDSITGQSDFILLPAGRLTVTVMDESDRPVAGAEVLYGPACEARGGSDARPFLSAVEIVRTDAQGRFVLDRALPTYFGAHTNPAELRVRHPAFVETRVLLDGARPVRANGETRLRVRLERGAAVVGTLSDADSGKPIAGLRVRALGDDYPDQAWLAASDADGRYELRVPAGRVRVQPQVPAGAAGNYYTVEDERTPFLYTAGAEPVEANFTFRRGQSLAGSVKVFAGGRPLGAGVTVAGLCVEAEELVKPTGRAWPLACRGDVTADGSFRIDHLRPGRYGLRVFHPRLGLWQRTDEPVARVEVMARSDATGIEIEVPPAWSPAALPELRGQVVDAAGAPVPNARVELRPAEVDATAYATFASTDGTFRLRGFAPGETWTLWAWDGRGRRATTVQIPRPEEWAGAFPLVLETGPRYMGTVRNEAGKPVVGAVVALCEEVKDRWGTGRVERPLRVSETDKQGRYVLDGCLMPPGRSNLFITVIATPAPDEPVGVRGVRQKRLTSQAHRIPPTGPDARGATDLDVRMREAAGMHSH